MEQSNIVLLVNLSLTLSTPALVLNFFSFISRALTYAMSTQLTFFAQFLWADVVFWREKTLEPGSSHCVCSLAEQIWCPDHSQYVPGCPLWRQEYKMITSSDQAINPPSIGNEN